MDPAFFNCIQPLLINIYFYFSRIADAEENLGESEVREAHLAKSLYFIRICDKVTISTIYLTFR
jgi:hypothetical protein